MIQTNSYGPGLPKLHLTNGYSVNFVSLARILHVVTRDQRKRIPQADLATTVGMTEKQVKYLGGIAQALGLVERGTYKPTKLGQLVQTYDPHIEDKGTLWFLHYVISSNPENLVWNRIVTTLLPRYKCFTREQACEAFDDLQQIYATRSLQSHISKELGTFLDAYINQQFSAIAYIYHQDSNYVLGAKREIHPFILGACIICFMCRYRSGNTAISVEDLLTAANGPGLILQLEENRFRALLEQLKWQPGFSLESRADLDQVRLTDDTQAYEWMERYYANR